MVFVTTPHDDSQVRVLRDLIPGGRYQDSIDQDGNGGDSHGAAHCRIDSVHGDVDRLVRDDPFWPTGLRSAVRVLAWRQVFADGKRYVAREAD